ncbi:MAG TPA: class II aldolase/adducin family protein [Casimicrobiaceae bacterium]|jgi:HCOMODA/2-hydroxy-3-carboxy-muconic semialdehyde decarboxylase|nr:class II aldolase/adducin family protein [Casimicrobiaceae bacterium]
MEPTLNTGAPSPADPALVESLAVANRILYDQGVVDGFGHVSVRHDRSPAHFLLARNMAPALVTPADILTFDLDGQALDAGDRRVYLERFIHAEIYRARTDVVAVVHSHSPSVIPFAATRTPLRPIYHMSGFLGAGSALFEIRDVAGDSDLLIRNAELGRALAASLGGNAAVLMRGHGSTVVGTSLQQVVYRAIYAETNARLQTQALALGDVTYLNEREAALAAATNDTQLARVWELWTRAVKP